MSSRVRSRAFFLVTGLTGVVVCGWFAIQTFLAKTDPENWLAAAGQYALTVGPPADVLERAAADRIQKGIAALNDRSRPAGERLSAYRADLATSESLLVMSLRANPASARILGSLAAVRWELRSPLSEEDAAELLDLIAAASSMAGAAPRTQMQLGEVLLKMGRIDDALTYISRAVELDSAMSRQAIGILRDHNFQADEILGALPLGADVLTALRVPFLEDGDSDLYLEALESAMSGLQDLRSRDLLVAYGTACLHMRAADRLLRTMTRIQVISDDAAEAARLYQISRAHLALGNPARAIVEIRRAIIKQPDAAYLQVHLGNAAVAAGDFDAAVEAFRNVLGILARESGSSLARATIYRKIGQAEEQRGEMGRAYDAYRMALELNPDEAHARKRLHEMEKAAGFRPS